MNRESAPSTDADAAPDSLPVAKRRKLIAAVTRLAGVGKRTAANVVDHGRYDLVDDDVRDRVRDLVDGADDPDTPTPPHGIRPGDIVCQTIYGEYEGISFHYGVATEVDGDEVSFRVGPDGGILIPVRTAAGVVHRRSGAVESKLRRVDDPPPPLAAKMAELRELHGGLPVRW